MADYQWVYCGGHLCDIGLREGCGSGHEHSGQPVSGFFDEGDAASVGGYGGVGAVKAACRQPLPQAECGGFGFGDGESGVAAGECLVEAV